jgi:hypothetical protein
METHTLLPRSAGGCMLNLLIGLLAIMLTVQSAHVQRPYERACDGFVGGGFPLPFLCDDLGESPTSSWGRIDETDWYVLVIFHPYFLVNVLFYVVLLWVPWFIVRGFSQLVRRRSRPKQRLDAG